LKAKIFYFISGKINWGLGREAEVGHNKTQLGNLCQYFVGDAVVVYFSMSLLLINLTDSTFAMLAHLSNQAMMSANTSVMFSSVSPVVMP